LVNAVVVPLTSYIGLSYAKAGFLCNGTLKTNWYLQSALYVRYHRQRHRQSQCPG
jgi:hypothetical protein